jgi:hypothetical protein
VKGLIAHAVLAVGGLVLAYVVWTDDGRGDGRAQVTVWDCDADAVSRVRLDGARHEVTLERRGKGSEAHWWVVHTSRPEKGEPTTKQFTASEQVSKYMEGLAPLRASREVGQLDDETLEQVGLHEPKDRLTVTCGGKDRTFLAGENAFGSGDRYLRDARGGTVYLADSALVRDLESAQARLMQRKLHTFEWNRIQHLHVDGYGEQKTLLQRNRHDPTQAEWVDAREPDRRNELYGNWLNRLRRLSVVEYLDPDQEPGGEGVDVQPVATLQFRDKKDDVVDELQLVRTVADDAVEYHARTGATRSWVRLPRSLAREIAQDVRPVLGLEPVDEPEPVIKPAPEAPAAAAEPGAADEAGDGAEAPDEAGDGAEAADEAGDGAEARTGPAGAAGAGAPEPAAP